MEGQNQTQQIISERYDPVSEIAIIIRKYKSERTWKANETKKCGRLFASRW
jgi:hypothetical protein